MDAIEAELAEALDTFEKKDPETYDRVQACRKLKERIDELAEWWNMAIQDAKEGSRNEHGIRQATADLDCTDKQELGVY